MTVADYKYYYDHFLNLSEFRDSNIKLLKYSELVKLDKEIKRIKSFLKLKK